MRTSSMMQYSVRVTGNIIKYTHITAEKMSRRSGNKINDKNEIHNKTKIIK